MKENYEKAEAFTLGLEGKSPVAKDIGDGMGLTKYGIAQKWHPDVDIASLTLNQAKIIYKVGYWDTAGCDGLPYPLDCITFDTSVNMGPGTAKAMAAQCNGNSHDLLDLRRNKYQRMVQADRRKEKFLDGWINRCDELAEHYLDG